MVLAVGFGLPENRRGDTVAETWGLSGGLMRAFVTGITGFVGGHLVEHLVSSGDQVAGMSTSGRWPKGLERLADLARIEPCDLAETDVTALAERIGKAAPEVVYHLAAQANPQAGMADPRGTWTLNVLGTLTLLEAIHRSGGTPRVVLVGTGICYGNPPEEQIPVREDCPLRPNNPYSASKAAADLMGIQHFLTHKTRVVIARPFNHAGPRQSALYVLSSFARQVAEIERGESARIDHGNLEVERDYTDVRDIVRAYRLLAVNGRPGEAYNIGTGTGTALSGALEYLRSRAAVPVELHADPARYRPVDLFRLVADSSKLRAATGWTAEIPIERTLDDMLAFWRENLANS
jgi:GDP-4-dehydro-6-deoxy-D-mannose reductase